MLLVGTLKGIKELRKTDKKARGGIPNEAQSKVSFPYSGIKGRDRRLEDGSDQAILADYT